MDKNVIISFRKKFAENRKAKKFIREYYKENGAMPASSAVAQAKALTEDEADEIELNVNIERSTIMGGGNETVATWDYIWNEETWNAAYNKENSPLKEYYDLYPDEDRWNTQANRPAQARDKVDGEWPDYCVRGWQGAVGAPGAQYPWCVVNIEPFRGNIRFNYDGGADVWPWGEANRTFKRHFAIASIPVELGQEFLLKDGETTFDPSKLVVTLVEA